MFVVLEQNDYTITGADVVGVYSTKAKALKAVNALLNEHLKVGIVMEANDAVTQWTRPGVDCDGQRDEYAIEIIEIAR